MKNLQTLKSPKASSIMNMSLNELKEFCKTALFRFDDYQQDCADLGNDELVDYFVESYNSLENILSSLNKNTLKLKVRNEIRMIIKESEKMAIVQDLTSLA